MPHLGLDAPVILYDYPASQAALANIRHASIPVAERFELFYQGIELANGYHELCDPHELARRTEEANAKRKLQGRQPLSQSGKLHAAMEAGLPPCTGVALGFDRLIMLAAKKKQLDEVMCPTNAATPSSSLISSSHTLSVTSSTYRTLSFSSSSLFSGKSF